MKVSWHGNRKHISARWHTKGLPVLHVAFLRERIQRGFKCYHDLTHKISQLWLTRVLNFHFFMRPCSSCFSLFLHRPIIWSIESTFLLHTFEYISSTLVTPECCWSTREHIQDFQNPYKAHSISVSHFLSTPGRPQLCCYHFSSSHRRRWSINWKAVRAHISFFFSFFHPIWSQVGEFHKLLLHRPPVLLLLPLHTHHASTHTHETNVCMLLHT